MRAALLSIPLLFLLHGTALANPSHLALRANPDPGTVKCDANYCACAISTPADLIDITCEPDRETCYKNDCLADCKECTGILDLKCVLNFLLGRWIEKQCAAVRPSILFTNVCDMC
ncbi:hypothetical protein Vi05172_g10461 [Venturia inaequalis]|nr:hypothetical protein Vi05172_g10461 [Venturia inaequalis]